jgi:hypothetical protein
MEEDYERSIDEIIYLEQQLSNDLLDYNDLWVLVLDHKVVHSALTLDSLLDQAPVAFPGAVFKVASKTQVFC